MRRRGDDFDDSGRSRRRGKLRQSRQQRRQKETEEEAYRTDSDSEDVLDKRGQERYDVALDTKRKQEEHNKRLKKKKAKDRKLREKKQKKIQRQRQRDDDSDDFEEEDSDEDEDVNDRPVRRTTTNVGDSEFSVGKIQKFKPSKEDQSKDTIIKLNDKGRVLRSVDPKNETSSTTMKPPTYVYVENLSTGTFQKVKISEIVKLINKQPRYNLQNRDIFDPQMQRSATITVSNIIGTFVIFIQGILAGSVIAHSVFIARSSNDINVLTQFQNNLREAGRLFFVGTTISLVGTIDLLLRELVEHSNVGKASFQYLPFKKIRLYVMTFIYLLAHLFTLLLAPTSQYIYFGQKVSTATNAEWLLLDTLRTVCCVLGWILACYNLQESSSSLHNAELRFEQEQRKMQSLQTDFEMFSGVGIDNLSVTKLTDLKKKLEIGLGATKQMLSVKKLNRESPRFSPRY